MKKGAKGSKMSFRIKARAGAKKAVIAVVPKLMVIAYSILKTKEPYREWGGDYFDKLNPERTAQRMLVRIAKLGLRRRLNGDRCPLLHRS